MHTIISQLGRTWLSLRAIPKTLIFNGRYFGFAGLFHLPVLVSHRVVLERLAGQIVVKPSLPRFSIRIGFGSVGLFDRTRSHTVFENEGTIDFQGAASIGHGSKLSVGPNGTLIFGDRAHIIAESSVRCAKQITLGARCLISWQNLIMDQDFHKIFDMNDPTGTPTNPDKEIVIGPDVWIGCRCTILKGAVIGPGAVVASGSLVTGVWNDGHQLLGGNPCRVLRNTISWRV
jgi:acetyltransferase-like isoleucine patch superfamily enzyme